MKRLIADYLRRRGPFLLVLLVLSAVLDHFAQKLFMGNDLVAKSFKPANLMFFRIFSFQIVFFLSFMQTTELANGIMRVALTLPVTARQIGTALWCNTVGIPSVGLLIAGLCAVLDASRPAESWVGVVEQSCFMALTLAACFGTKTISKLIQPGGISDRFARLRMFMYSGLSLLPLLGW